LIYSLPKIQIDKQFEINLLVVNFVVVVAEKVRSFNRQTFHRTEGLHYVGYAYILLDN